MNRFRDNRSEMGKMGVWAAKHCPHQPLSWLIFEGPWRHCPKIRKKHIRDMDVLYHHAKFHANRLFCCWEIVMWHG